MQNSLNSGKVVNISITNIENAVAGVKVSKPRFLSPVNPMSKVVEISPKIALSQVKIIKKDGTKEDYNIQKVVSAIKKSAARMLVEFSQQEIDDICELDRKSVV